MLLLILFLCHLSSLQLFFLLFQLPFDQSLLLQLLCVFVISNWAWYCTIFASFYICVTDCSCGVYIGITVRLGNIIRASWFCILTWLSLSSFYTTAIKDEIPNLFLSRRYQLWFIMGANIQCFSTTLNTFSPYFLLCSCVFTWLQRLLSLWFFLCPRQYFAFCPR